MVKTFVCSDRGPRAENQDFYCLTPLIEGLLVAVADGVGGNNGGETASHFAIKTLQEKTSDGLPLEECFEMTHTELIAKGKSFPHLMGMATTLTAIRCNGPSLYGAHCGDSRAYVLRQRGLKQLTVDHTEVARLIAEGQLTKEEAVNYPRKNIITSALGTHKNLIVQSFNFDIMPKDRLLLLTDGVYARLTKREIQRMSEEAVSFEMYCRSLIDLVKDRGPTDNYTLLAVEF